MRSILCFVALAMFTAAPLSAQQPLMVDINGFGGAYVGTTDLLDPEDPLAEGVEISQATAAAFGGRVTVWLAEMFGIEGGFSLALSDLEQVVDDTDLCEEEVSPGEPDPCDTSVVLASVRGVYRFVPTPDGIIAIHIGGGPAIISRSGDAVEDVDGTTDIGGVINVGATFDVTPMVAIRLDVEDYLYSAKFSAEDPVAGEIESESKFQNDLMFTGGISIKVGGTRR